MNRQTLEHSIDFSLVSGIELFRFPIINEVFYETLRLRVRLFLSLCLSLPFILFLASYQISLTMGRKKNQRNKTWSKQKLNSKFANLVNISLEIYLNEILTPLKFPHRFDYWNENSAALIDLKIIRIRTNRMRQAKSKKTISKIKNVTSIRAIFLQRVFVP